MKTADDIGGFLYPFYIHCSRINFSCIQSSSVKWPGLSLLRVISS